MQRSARISKGLRACGPTHSIPETDYFYQENRSAFPVDLQPGQRVVAWVDVLVPVDQPEGTYTGSISVTAIQGGVRETVATVPVALTVFDFSILFPRAASLPSSRSRTPLNLALPTREVRTAAEMRR